ncbi:MAG: hypothetical protein RSE38_15105 [Acinetobacter sp.]
MWHSIRVGVQRQLDGHHVWCPYGLMVGMLRAGMLLAGLGAAMQRIRVGV